MGSNQQGKESKKEMKIHVPYVSNQKIGGGYTFHDNFMKAMSDNFPEIKFVSEDEDHDILFAFSPTTVSGEIIERSKAKGAKFVLRMDGVPEDNRNSGKGTRRLVEYSLKADHIVYQSEFVINTVGKILQNNGVDTLRSIIPNGVDTEVFRPDGEKLGLHGDPKILHIAYRKDNNKRYEEVVAMYREYAMTNRNANLILLGRYPTEWQDYNMGFFNGEKFQRLGVVTDREMKARMIRACDILFYPSFADPAPNVVLEALACGVPVLYNAYGGVAEMVRPKDGNPAGLPIDYNFPFSKQIDAVLSNRDVYSLNAHNIALNHSLDIMAIRYKQTFDLL